MQKGLATLEIILAIMIIAILANSTIPNVARIIDKAALDYETKRLYSELRFVQTMSKSGTVLSTGMNNIKIVSSTAAPPTLVITSAKDGYQVFRGTGDNKKAIREPHYLANDTKISFGQNVSYSAINFDETGKANINGKLILTSRLGEKSCIVFDTVGRIRASVPDD